MDQLSRRPSVRQVLVVLPFLFFVGTAYQRTADGNRQHSNDNNNNSTAKYRLAHVSNDGYVSGTATLEHQLQILERLELLTLHVEHIERQVQQQGQAATDALAKTAVVAVAPTASSSLPRDCADLYGGAGANASDVYTVYAGRTDSYLHPVQVYCDMTTDGGGWTVVQRRQDGSENFYRHWDAYATGFGNLLGEYWLGNDNLYALTRTKQYRLRIDMTHFNGSTRYAEYDNFKVGSDCDKYKLVSLGTYSGSAGDSLTGHVGQKFSTHDQDNDVSEAACAVLYKGAWWYSACHASNLNGYYYGGQHTTHADGVNWQAWTGYHYSLKYTEMKIRPVGF